MAEQQYGSFSSLRGLIRQPRARERCDLCGVGLLSEHEHLIDPKTHKVVCACTACGLLFPSTGQTKYKRVPRRIRYLKSFRITDGQWDGLLVPIGVAYFLKSSVEARVVSFYPSPAGPTESMLSLDVWEDIVQENPSLAEMESDTEALLVNRLEHIRHGSEYYLVPIDKCYELVGLIRSRWRGLSGGTEVWEEIRRFFKELKERATPERVHA